MTSEVAGDPTTLPGLRADYENGPRRPAASPADAYDCIMVHSISKGSTEYKAVARDERSTSRASSPRILSAAIAVLHVTSNQVPLSAKVRRLRAFAPIAEVRTSNAKCVAPESTHPAVVLAAVKDAARR